MRSRKLIVSRASAPLEVVPERVRVLEPDREPEEARWHALTLPAGPGLDARRDAAEARHVHDQPRRGLDPASRVRVGDVEREEAAEAGIANDGHGRMALEPLGDRGRALRLSRDAHLERLQPAEEEPRSVGGRDRAGARPELEQPRGVLGALHTSAPTSASSCPARYFVAEWSAMSQPSSSGRTWSGVAAVESQTTRAGCAAAAAKSGIVRNGFDGASSQTRSTPSGGGPVWSNSTFSIPQRASSSRITPVP